MLQKKRLELDLSEQSGKVFIMSKQREELLNLQGVFD